ncbi:MAG TPA: hypothetical protein ENG62_03365, partial [Thermoplasmatales archaeon]|nr:hypothetical protein [Thermoplasmatales archaeon]
PTTLSLPTENDSVRVVVYIPTEDGGEEIVFDGVLRGRTELDSTPSRYNTPYLISTLLTNTTEEDLICFNVTNSGEPLNDSSEATTFIYRWMVNGEPITNLLLPFTINNATTAIDYSGNNHHGIIHDATWVNSGVIDGAYSFNDNSYISIPYCFKENKVGRITVEVWVKTTENSGVILSFNRSNYFELSIIDKRVRWSTTVNGDIEDLLGDRIVADGNWHLITATYNSDTGEASIYIDGLLDVSQIVHNPGDKLGTQDISNGYIGKKLGVDTSSSGNVTVLLDNFEEDNGWTVENSPNLQGGEWERGIPVSGSDGAPSSDYDGSGKCYLTENKPGDSDVDRGSTYLISPTLDLSSYSDAVIKYAIWYTNNFGLNPNSDYFHVYVSNDSGNSWILIDTIGPETPMPPGWMRYTIHLRDYTNLTNTMKLRFEASDLGRPSTVEAGVDAVEVIGVPSTVNPNFTGEIDELRIYNRVLSGEQIYQNYLCMVKKTVDKNVIVSEETLVGETWKCNVTPANSQENFISVDSNELEIINYGGG